MPDLNEISVMCREIKKMNPVLVLNVGGGSVVADMCRHFTRTASIPCSYDIPFSMSEYLILPRNTKESDSRIIENLLPYQKLVNTIYNYSCPEDSDMLYDRKMFNINENAFVVATVGFRLDKEMDEAFLKAAGQILDLDERICFVIFGEVEDRDRITGCVGKTDQIVFAGEVDDSAQCIKLADVYINPERAGGGRSAFEALYSGIPVITLKYGDVWGVTGDEFAVDDYDEMVKRVFSYMSDRSFYRRMSALSQSRAYELADMETTVKKIFDDLGVSYPRK